MRIEDLESCPSALRREIEWRIGIGAALIPVFIGVWVYNRSLGVALPILVIAVFLLFSGFQIFNAHQRGTIVAVAGKCTGIERNRLRGTEKSVRLDVQGKAVEIYLRGRRHQIQAGDTVTVYLAETTPVYENHGVSIIYRYYAIMVEKESALANPRG